MNDDFTPEAITAKLAERGLLADNLSHEDEEVEEISAEEDTVEEESSEEEASQVLEDPESPESIEKLAAEQGWKPDGEKSAAEFLRAAPLYDEIKNRGREIKELKATLDELKAHQDKQIKLGYEQALRDLEQQRIDAIEMGDVASVTELDAQIHEQREHIKPEKPVLPPEVVSFGERHKDWIEDPSYQGKLMREFAKERDEELLQYNLPPEEHLKVIEKDLKMKFKDYFGNKEVDSEEVYPSVESGAPAPRKSKKVTFADLSPEQKKCARHFEKRGVMTVEAYIKQLKQLGDI